MNVHIYDTHVHTEQGEYIHFDVLVDDGNVDNVKHYAKKYLDSLGVKTEQIKQSRCNFCNSEVANLEVKSNIKNQGYSIIRL